MTNNKCVEPSKEYEMVNLWGIKRRIARVLKGRASSGQAITFFEVKELYNLAYEQKAQARNALRQFKRTEAKAKAMDTAYRSQLKLTARVA